MSADLLIDIDRMRVLSNQLMSNTVTILCVLHVITQTQAHNVLLFLAFHWRKMLFEWSGKVVCALCATWQQGKRQSIVFSKEIIMK